MVKAMKYRIASILAVVLAIVSISVVCAVVWVTTVTAWNKLGILIQAEERQSVTETQATQLPPSTQAYDERKVLVIIRYITIR